MKDGMSYNGEWLVYPSPSESSAGTTTIYTGHDGNGNMIGQIGEVYGCDKDSQRIAKLMASSPAMLEALQEICGDIQLLDDVHPDELTNNKLHKILKGIGIFVEKVIAKAEGNDKSPDETSKDRVSIFAPFDSLVEGRDALDTAVSGIKDQSQRFEVTLVVNRYLTTIQERVVLEK